jgi:hypothetical protein
MFKNLKVLIVFGCFFLIACTSTKNKPLSIEFSSDSNKIVIKNINEAGLYQLKINLNTDSTYQKLVAVLQTPSDKDSTTVEVELPGMLSMQGDSLLFTPNTSFIKGKTYLVETFINTEFASGKDIIHSDVGHSVKPIQKTLKR